MTYQTVLKRLAVAVCLSSALVNAQSANYSKILPNDKSSDEKKIRVLLDEVIQGVRQGNTARIVAQFISEQKSVRLTADQNRFDDSLRAILRQGAESGEHSDFSFQVLSIIVNGGSAHVKVLPAGSRAMIGDTVTLSLHKAELAGWKFNSPSELSSILNYYNLSGSSEKIDASSRTNGGGSTKRVRSTNSSSTTVIVPTSHMLIPMPFGWVGGSTVWQTTKSDAQANLNKDLFSNPVDADYAAISADGNSVTSSVTFAIDRDWRRIVFGGDVGSWLKSYGDWPGDRVFLDPVALQVLKLKSPNQPWIIYVADYENDELENLQYDPASQSISFLNAVRNNIHKPKDIIAVPWSQRGGVNGEHKLFVVDWQFGGGSILYLDQDAQLLAKITGYTYGGTTYPLTNVVRLICKMDLYIVLIDQDQNAVVTLRWEDIPTLPNTIAVATNFVKFDPPSSLNSVGYGANFNNLTDFYVTDNGLNLVHKFSYSGAYLASFSNFNASAAVSPDEFNGRAGVGLFNSPVMFGSSNYNNPDITHLGLYTFNTWSTSGFQWFYPGADIISVSNQATPSGITFLYTLSNECTYTSRVVNDIGSVVLDFNPQSDVGTANKYADYVDYAALPDGIFYWKGSAQPYYNSTYTSGGHNFSQNPVVVTGSGFITPPRLASPPDNATNQSVLPTFSWNANPKATSYTLHIYNYSHSDDRTVTVSNTSYTPTTNLQWGQWYWWEVSAYGAGLTSQIAQRGFSTRPWLGASISGPSCVDAGSSGTWSASVSGSVGLVSYAWYYSYSGTGGPWLPFFPNTSSSITFSPSSAVSIKCTVTDASLSVSPIKSITVGCSPPPSCPFVYPWDGNEFREDNNILPQSEYPQNIGNDVTDFYRLLKPMGSLNGKYALQIREFENERSYLDQFRLLAIDHPTGTRIDVDPSTGEIHQYTRPYRLSRALLKGAEITSALASMDSNSVEVGGGDTLNISLSDLAPNGTVPINSGGERTISSLGGGSESAASTCCKQQKTAYVERGWAPSGAEGPPATASIAYRQRKTLVFTPMSIDSITSWNLIVRTPSTLDYVNFGVNVTPSNYTVHELTLAAARHSTDGNVLSKLAEQDSVYATLIPGQAIELRYTSIDPPADGITRSFILISRGRYEKVSDSSSVPLDLSPRPVPNVTNYDLASNYPNPFNPTTSIHFELPFDGHVVLSIYNTLGQLITQLVDRDLAKGRYDESWDANSYGSGIYFYRLSVTDHSGKLVFSDLKKMLLIK